MWVQESLPKFIFLACWEEPCLYFKMNMHVSWLFDTEKNLFGRIGLQISTSYAASLSRNWLGGHALALTDSRRRCVPTEKKLRTNCLNAYLSFHFDDLSTGHSVLRTGHLTRICSLFCNHTRQCFVSLSPMIKIHGWICTCFTLYDAFCIFFCS